jgi:phage gp29-like protein
MSTLRGLIQGVKGWLGKPVATPETDPERFFSSLAWLPNPDPILRQMGRADAVYHSIMMDAHVMGEIRSIRGSFRSHEYRLVVGREDDAKAAAALDTCKRWMESGPPNKVADWMEVMWQMCSCILTGYKPHELVWGYNADGKLVPTEVADRPGRRILFDAYANPLLVSKTTPLGAPVEPYQFVVSRHMATTDNPYGMALLSSCFWPWTFKTGGWRYFVKYCERHGLPWPVGRYPQGTSEEEQDILADALASMVESGYLVVQEGIGIELLVPQGGSGSTPQQELISLANREMSKALTSQAMIGEQLTVGSKAAADTAQVRQNSVHDSDRDIAAASMSQIFRWITLFNFGEGVPPPTLEFFRQEDAGKARADTYDVARKAGAKPSRKAMLIELGIPEAEDASDELLPDAPPVAQPAAAPALPKPKLQLVNFSRVPGYSFAQAVGMTDDEALQLATDTADQVIEDTMIAPIARMLAEFEASGKTLQQFNDALQDMVGQMDDEGLREVLERALSYSILRGAATNAP